MDDIFETLYNCDINEFDQLVTALKQKWSDIEKNHTRNKGEEKFVKYFEKYKQKSFKDKLIKSARESAHLSENYWQNPVEWANYLVKDELRKKLGTAKTVAITDAVEVLKERNIRLYSNVAKAIYNNGPYKLSLPFEHFEMSFNEWFSLSRERKEQHLKEFFSYVPPKNDINPEAVDTEPNNDIEETSEISCSKRKTLPISFEELKLEDIIPRETLQNIFKEAENLLNMENGVTTAATNDDRVKNLNSSYPLIITPNKKNR